MVADEGGVRRKAEVTDGEREKCFLGISIVDNVLKLGSIAIDWFAKYRFEN